MTTTEDNPAGVGRPIEPGETGCGYTGRTPDAAPPCGAPPISHLLVLSGWPGKVGLAACEAHADVAYRAGTVLGEHPYYVTGCDDPGLTEEHWRPEPDEVEPPSEVVFLLWSGKWQSWWRPNAAGYTTDQARAGRYSEADALRHVRDSAMCGNLADVTSMVAAPDNWQRT